MPPAAHRSSTIEEPDFTHRVLTTFGAIRIAHDHRARGDLMGPLLKHQLPRRGYGAWCHAASHSTPQAPGRLCTNVGGNPSEQGETQNRAPRQAIHRWSSLSRNEAMRTRYHSGTSISWRGLRIRSTYSGSAGASSISGAM